MSQHIHCKLANPLQLPSLLLQQTHTAYGKTTNTAITVSMCSKDFKIATKTNSAVFLNAKLNAMLTVAAKKSHFTTGSPVQCMAPATL